MTNPSIENHSCSDEQQNKLKADNAKQAKNENDRLFNEEEKKQYFQLEHFKRGVHGVVVVVQVCNQMNKCVRHMCVCMRGPRYHRSLAFTKRNKKVKKKYLERCAQA